MKIIIELAHPKHYHQFKNLSEIFKSNNNDVIYISRPKDIVEQLLTANKEKFISFGHHKKGIFNKFLNGFLLIKSYYKIIKTEKPDIIISKASPYAAILRFFFKFNNIIFPDSEVVVLTNKFVSKKADIIITPKNFEINFGLKHFKINGLFENCYLDPRYNTINEFDFSQLQRSDWDNNKPIAFFRFVAMEANHDIGNNGLSTDQKIELVNLVKEKSNVIISSEKKLPSALEPYQLINNIEKIHSILKSSHLYIGDSQTMASESAILGTPSIRSNSFVGKNDMSNFIYLESKQLLTNTNDFNLIKTKMLEIINSPIESKNNMKDNLDKYYQESGDVNLEINKIITQNR
jgi:predicted glycosyltransferase